MILNVPPCRSEVRHTICEFHKRNPHTPHAGCMCSSSYVSVPLTPEEIEQRSKAHKCGHCDGTGVVREILPHMEGMHFRETSTVHSMT